MMLSEDQIKTYLKSRSPRKLFLETYANFPTTTDPEIIKAVQEHWGVFDWTKPTNYPQRKEDLCNDAWRWELLRRDDTYRSDWEDYAHGNRENSSAHRLIAYGIKEFYNPTQTYNDLKEKPTFNRYPMVVDDGDIAWQYPDHNEVIGNDIDFILKNELEGKLDLRFDLDKPLYRQIEDADKLLTSMQVKKHSKKLRERKLDNPSCYLRVADAMLFFVKPKIIDEMIFNSYDGSSTTRGWQAIYEIADDVWLHF